MTYILYNPKANNGQGEKCLGGVQRAIMADHPGASQVQVLDITRLTPADFLSGLTEEDVVVLCGGDGTLHRFVNDIAGVPMRPDIFFWPVGTGNDFVRDVGAGKNKLVKLNDYIQSLPYAEVDGVGPIRFLNNVCFGLDGQVCELGEQEKERLGRKVNYAVLAIRLALRDYQLTSATVTVDGVTKHYDKVWLASALNGRYVGGGMKLAPGQDRKSDKLCCVVMAGTGRLYLLSRLASVYWGGHVKIPCCEVLYGNEIEVTFDKPTALNMDGEVISGVTHYKAVK